MYKRILLSIAILIALATPIAQRAQADTSATDVCSLITSNVHLGHSDRSIGNREISALQLFLAAQGYSQPITGYFGSQTYQNVLHLQHRYGIMGTGNVGPLTRALIAQLCGSSTPPPPIGGLTVTAPTGGQVVQSGSTTLISWSYPVTPGSAAMVIDLYTSTGTKVGTIAISSNTIGSYAWSVPPYPNNQMCTQQFPNGLCNATLQGQYYVQVSAVSGNGLDQSQTVYASGRSGVFTISSAIPQGQSVTLSAAPASGTAPLVVTFGLNTDAGLYALSFGDGMSASLRSGTTAHTYTTPGTYTAQFTTDAACLHTTPVCSIPTRVIGTLFVRAY